MKTQAIVYAEPNRVECMDIEVPEPVGDQFLIETILTAVSPGTELRNLSGQQAGQRYPAIGGYMCLGRVIGRGAGAARGIPDGTLVFCGGTERASIQRSYGGHVAHAVNDKIFVVPEGVAARDAVVSKMCAIAYQGTRLSRPTPADSVAVVGLGPIGQLSLRLHTVCGSRAVGFDLSARRVASANAAGCQAQVITGTLADTAKPFAPNGFDIVVDATGAAPVLMQSVHLLRQRGWQESPLDPGVRLVIQGSYPGSITLDYHPVFMTGATIHIPRDNQDIDVSACLDLMARKLLRSGDLVSEVFAPSEAALAYHRLATQKDALMTVAFKWKNDPALD